MLRKCKKKSSDPPFVWKLEGAGQWEHFHCPAPSHRFRRRSNSLNFCSSESPVNLLFHIGRTISHDLKIRRILGSKTERLHFLGRFRPSHCPAPSHPTPIRSITLIFCPSDSPENLLFPTGKTNRLHLKIPRMVSFRYGKAKNGKNGHFWLFLANYGPISHRIWGFRTQNLYKVCGDTRWGILGSFGPQDSFF